MIRAFRIAAGALVLVLLVGGGLAAKFLIPQKAFSVPRVVVDGTLETDGTLRVVEHITYKFTGQFHFGTRPIPVGNYAISNMVVTEHSKAPVTADQRRVSVASNMVWFLLLIERDRSTRNTAPRP